VFADVLHAFRLGLFCVAELVNPDRLRHIWCLRVQLPLWHTRTPANTCPKGQMCSARIST
jgi:hypothetical protein